jgi:hypothetical protein
MMTYSGDRPSSTAGPEKRQRHSHIFPREEHEHYVEPAWCSERLFEEELFVGAVHDPCCGFGTIPEAAIRAGLTASSADLVDRGYALSTVEDFFATSVMRDNIVCNPPYDKKIIRPFIEHALSLARHKVVILLQVTKLNAASWLRYTPLCRIWLLQPRPSTPPGHYIMAGKKPESGRPDYCWLVFERGFDGDPKIRWLRRYEGGSSSGGAR